ncbi:hypothetical protein PCH_Pc22g21880 [Penicillium rubens Wisconsin 54-1255]|uniref:Uncharacterized protein n=1 Tax=Penicillium rubens (strain ATCC 28089 / DSM 1075 / NRRL 1951 / Wisconsin 54-1255) TaxID=500485 RepID=B6HTB4_PENRW|nr:hypothetical protein PCH_Pc22g21880 [Penicillium rubens Wisconsin 54-1255]
MPIVREEETRKRGKKLNNGPIGHDEVITRDLYLVDPERQGAKGWQRDEARIQRMTIGQEAIKCPSFGANATLMAVLIMCGLKAWGLWSICPVWLDGSKISGRCEISRVVPLPCQGPRRFSVRSVTRTQYEMSLFWNRTGIALSSDPSSCWCNDWQSDAHNIFMEMKDEGWNPAEGSHSHGTHG